MWRVACYGFRRYHQSIATKCHQVTLKPRQSSTNSTPAALSWALVDRAKSLEEEHTRLSRDLGQTYDAAIAKRVGTLSDVSATYKAWNAAKESIHEIEQLIRDSATDKELRSIASDELAEMSAQFQAVSQALKYALVPPHPFAQLPCLIELRPGAGGDEAALFAGDLFRMYQAYCKRNGLRHNTLSLTTSATSGEESITEAVLEIPDPSSYERLRPEAGVHRVQRVPATETKGRTHTSAVSVLVLPSFPAKDEGADSESNFDDPESDYYVNPKEVRIDTMRASGAGGQHVNMTDSAVRLTHLPTGMVVSMQTSRSQHKNRESAWQLLRSRLAQQRREAREEEMAALRTSIVGVAKTGRGDKVRTYNWGQQRVTDHRSGITLNRLNDVLEGGESLQEIMSSVGEWLRDKDLEAMIADEEAGARAKQRKK